MCPPCAVGILGLCARWTPVSLPKHGSLHLEKLHGAIVLGMLPRVQIEDEGWLVGWQQTLQVQRWVLNHVQTNGLCVTGGAVCPYRTPQWGIRPPSGLLVGTGILDSKDQRMHDVVWDGGA